MFFIWINWMIDAGCHNPFQVYNLNDFTISKCDISNGGPKVWKQKAFLLSKDMRGDVPAYPAPKNHPNWVVIRQDAPIFY